VDIRLAIRLQNGDLLRLRDDGRNLAPNGPAAGTLAAGKLTDGRQEAPRREAQFGSTRSAE